MKYMTCEQYKGFPIVIHPALPSKNSLFVLKTLQAYMHKQRQSF